MKIAVLFRGPVRPNNQSVLDRVHEFLSQFNGQPVEIHTYLATWRYWKEEKSTDLINVNVFDNVIMQTEPTDERISKFVSVPVLKNTVSVGPPFKMYYQSKTAIDLICNNDDYDFIVHTRTDLQMIIYPYFNEWFDPLHYVALHTHPEPFTTEYTPWLNDQFGIAPAALMKKAWDYGTLENLGKLLDQADIPERVLQTIVDTNGVPVKSAPHSVWNLDPERNS